MANRLQDKIEQWTDRLIYWNIWRYHHIWEQHSIVVELQASDMRIQKVINANSQVLGVQKRWQGNYFLVPAESREHIPVTADQYHDVLFELDARKISKPRPVIHPLINRPD